MFTYEIVSPESIAAQGQAHMVVLEAAEGQLGLLENHAPLVAQLAPGLVSIFQSEETPAQQYFVTGGLVSMMDNRCVLLADEALSFAGLTHTLVEARMKVAEDAKVLAVTEREKMQALRLETIANAMKSCLT